MDLERHTFNDLARTRDALRVLCEAGWNDHTERFGWMLHRTTAELELRAKKQFEKKA